MRVSKIVTRRRSRRYPAQVAPAPARARKSPWLRRRAFTTDGNNSLFVRLTFLECVIAVLVLALTRLAGLWPAWGYLRLP